MRSVIALGLLLPSIAWAERPVGYAEALEAASRQAPSRVRSGLARDQAEASVTIARGAFDPRFGATGSWNREVDKGFFQGFPYDATFSQWSTGATLSGESVSGTGYLASYRLARNFNKFTTDFGVSNNESIEDAYRSTASVAITQQLLEGAWLSYNLQSVTQARKTFEAAEIAEEASRQQTIADAAAAYWAWVYAQGLAGLGEEAVRVAEESLRVGTLRVEAGDLAPVERTRLEAALVQAQSDLLVAQTTEQNAADALLLLMGEAPGQDVIASTDPGAVPELQIDVDKAVEVAVAQNLDLAGARVQVDASKSALAAARHQALPSLSTTASIGVEALQDTAGAAISSMAGDNALPFATVSAELSLPLRNRQARGGIDRAHADLAMRELDVAELERTVRAQVEQQVRELATARRRVELADANVRLAEETLSAEEALARAGRSIQKNVLEARTGADRARAEAIKARTDYRTAVVELMRLQGQIGAEAP